MDTTELIVRTECSPALPYSARLEINPLDLRHCVLHLTGIEGRTLSMTLNISSNFSVTFQERFSPVQLASRVEELCPAFGIIAKEVREEILSCFKTGILSERFMIVYQPVSDFTRSLVVWTAALPDHFLCFGGFGYGKADHDGRTLSFTAPVFDPSRDVRELYAGFNAGRGLQGKTYGATYKILPNGRRVKSISKAPIGCYTLRELNMKTEETLKLNHMQLTNLSLPQFVLFGEFADAGWRKKVGCSVYLIPLSITADIVAEITQSVAKEHPGFYPSEEFFYGLYAYRSSHALGTLHRQDIVHNQYHQGNRPLDITGPNLVIVKDFTTIQSVHKHDNSTPTKALGYLTAKQAALSQELWTCIRQDILTYITGPSHESLAILGSYPKNGPLYPTEKLIDIALTIAAWSVSGYKSQNNSIPSNEEIQRQKIGLRALVLQSCPELLDHNFIDADLNNWIATLSTMLATWCVCQEFPKKLRVSRKKRKKKRR